MSDVWQTLICKHIPMIYCLIHIIYIYFFRSNKTFHRNNWNSSFNMGHKVYTFNINGIPLKSQLNKNIVICNKYHRKGLNMSQSDKMPFLTWQWQQDSVWYCHYWFESFCQFQKLSSTKGVFFHFLKIKKIGTVRWWRSSMSLLCFVADELKSTQLYIAFAIYCNWSS